MRHLLLLLLLPLPVMAHVETIRTDLLIVGGDEAGCAAAVQAARLGVKRIVLVNDIDWLGGQFCTQGIGPIDEWTLVEGRRTEFPASGAFLEILQRIHAHNRRVYGVARPGNAWCGANTIEPQAAARIFDDWLAPYAAQIRILRRYEPVRVLTAAQRVTGVVFRDRDGGQLTVEATLTADSTDFGDVIRLSGAGYMAGPDLKSRFHEPSAPEKLEPGDQQEMNPLSFCPLLREAGRDSTIPRPARYNPQSFADLAKTPVWVDWDGSGGIYDWGGYCIYIHRRMVDRYHFRLPPGTEATILNWPAQDYPLSTLPQHVVDALEQTAAGASQQNIVEMTPAQRRIVLDDAKQRALEFVYWLQTAAHDRTGDFPQSFRYMKLADDYGTPDHLPPKPYLREGLRLEALYVLREQDVRTAVDNPLWAKAMAPDGVFGYQFNIDFHPTRRKFAGGDATQPWQPRHAGARNWSTHTDRAMFPLRGLVPLSMDGLLGCSKNIGVTSMVQSSLRLHGQMMHVGTAVGTVAALALRDGIPPREIASSPRRIRDVQTRIVRGAAGPGTLVWPWHDVPPEATYFEAANLLAVAGVWQADKNSVFFDARRTMTRRELAGVLVRLVRALPDAPPWPDDRKEPLLADVPATAADRAVIEALARWGKLDLAEKRFAPDAPATWDTLRAWLVALQLPVTRTLTVRPPGPPLTQRTLLRAECVDFVYRVLQQRGEFFPPERTWLQPNHDDDGDGRNDYDDPLPFDRDNDNVPDRLQPPKLPMPGN